VVAVVDMDMAAWAWGSAAWVVVAAAVAAVCLCSSMMSWVARGGLACNVPARTGAERNSVERLFTGCPESADLDLERVIIQHLVTVMSVLYHA
jgi:hypothetical protein